MGVLFKILFFAKNLKSKIICYTTTYILYIKNIISFNMNYKITIFRTKYINTEKTVNSIGSKLKKLQNFGDRCNLVINQ